VWKVNNRLWRIVLAVAVLALGPGPLGAQRLLDLPVRTTAEPDALVAGAAAALWNPAGAGRLTGRAEVLFVEVLVPEPMGLGGFALAGAYVLDARSTIAIAYQHVGADEIQRTTTSPLPEDGASPLNLREDVFALAAAQHLFETLTVGVSVRWARASEIVEERSLFAFGAGVDYRARLPWTPTIAGAVSAERDGSAWLVGLRVTPYGRAGSDWQAHASWGAGAGPTQPGLSHRFAAMAAWRRTITVSAGAAGEPGAANRTWRPLAAAQLGIGRYALGVVREDLPNGFGAIHAFRFSVTFR
jgi:hypothetical protein